MGYEHALALAGSSVFLVLSGLAVVRARRNPLVPLLGVLCVDFFGYTTLSFVHQLTQDPLWQWRERATAAIAAPLTLHLILAFVGAQRRMRWFLGATYVYFGLIALLCFAQVFDSVARVIDTITWAHLMLAGVAPVSLAAATLIARVYGREPRPEKRMRTQLLVCALVLGVGGSVTDLLSLAGANEVPRLSAIGLILSAFVLTAVVHRFRVVEGRIGIALLNAVVISTVGVLAQVALFGVFGANLFLLAFGTLVILLGVIAAARPALTAITEQRERNAYLITLGRLSAQMAHDVRNPLSAIRGAAQFLEEEVRRGRSVDDQLEMLSLIIEQSDRLETVVADYRRYGRVEPTLQSIRMNRIVDGALRACEATPSAVAIRVERNFDDQLPTCDADPDLIAGALENLIRNACEAMPEGGTLAVRTELVKISSRSHAIRMTIEDTGGGMDRRAQQHAFESFYTTKKGGTGLGLPFVRRVAEVHGGRVEIQSRLGRGTSIAFEIAA